MSNITTRSGFAPQTMAEAMQFSETLAASSMVPRAYQGKPQDILVCVQWGYEIGLAPMQALQNIAVINGKPSVYGDAALALVQASPVCEGIEESIEGEGTSNPVAVCVAQRRGRKPVTAKFSVEDAKRAGLWGKQGPWTQYPKRMLAMRARGFALRDAFPDVLKGLITAEEAQDYPVDAAPRDITPRPVANPLDAIAAPQAPMVIPETVDVVAAHIEEITREVVQENVDVVEIPEVVVVAAPHNEESWYLAVPGKGETEYPSYADWSAAYEELCDKVATAGKASAEVRMSKLNQLRESNEHMFIRLSVDDKVNHLQAYAKRKAAVLGTANG